MVPNPVRLIGTRKRRRSRPSQSLPSRPEAIAARASLRLIWIKHQRRSIILSHPRPAEHLAREEIGNHFSCRNARHLADVARNAGLQELIAEVLPENTAMLKVFKKFGFRPGSKREPQVIHLTMQLA
jgi:hypothetical protein